MLSGAEVASIPVEELSDVRALKQTLHLFHGLPPRFRQRLVLRGDPLLDPCWIQLYIFGIIKPNKD